MNWMTRGWLIALISIVAFSAPLKAQDNPLAMVEHALDTDPRAWAVYGDLLLEASRFNDAEKAYQKALKRDRDNQEAKLGITQVLLGRRDLKRARLACNGLAEKHESAGMDQVCLGRFWLASNRIPLAHEAFKKAVAQGAVVLGQLGDGDTFRVENRWTEATAAYQAAIDAGSSYLAHIGMGLSLDAQGKTKDALEAFQRAVESQPASCMAQYHVGRLLGPSQEGMAHLKTALLLKSPWPEVSFQLGTFFMQMGDARSAATALETATRESPVQRQVMEEWGRALSTLGEYAKAVTALEAAIRLDATAIDAYLLLAEVQFKLGNGEAASVALNKAKEVAPEDAHMYFQAGEIFFRLSRYTNARSNFQQAVALQPRHSRALIFLGRIACARKLVAEGKAHFDNALQGNMQGVTKAEIDTFRQACKAAE